MASRAYVVTLSVNDDLSKKSRLRLSGIVFADLLQGLEFNPQDKKKSRQAECRYKSKRIEIGIYSS